MEGHEANLEALVWDSPKAKRAPKAKVKRAISFSQGDELEGSERSRRQAKKPKP